MGGPARQLARFGNNSRHGAPLRRSTCVDIVSLREYHKHICHSPFIWYNFINKPLTLKVAEQHSPRRHFNLA